jgi:hypothetical protein
LGNQFTKVDSLLQMMVGIQIQRHNTQCWL